MKPDDAYVELAEAKKAVKASRRAFTKSTDSVFVKAMKAVMSQYLQARAQGVSRDDGIKGIEAELRDAWPNAVSKFGLDCQACDDTGFVEHTCWHEQRCGRRVCALNPEYQHAYVTFCHCPKGDRKRPKQRAPEDDLASVGKTAKKRGGFTRMGG